MSSPDELELARRHFYVHGIGELGLPACARCGAVAAAPIHIRPGDAEDRKRVCDATLERGRELARRPPTRAELERDRRNWP